MSDAYHEVERNILSGADIHDWIVAGCINWLVGEWLHNREAGLEIVASSYRERLAAIVEAMKNGE